MKVYLCYDCYETRGNVFKALTIKTLTKVFDHEVKALMWMEESVSTDKEWREYSEMIVE